MGLLSKGSVTLKYSLRLYPHPYEALKALTRTNQAITEASIKEFIEGLNVSEEIKKELRVITPHTYTGI